MSAPTPTVCEARVPLEPQQAAMIAGKMAEARRLTAAAEELVIFAASGAKIAGDLRSYDLATDAAGAPVLVLQVAANAPEAPPPAPPADPPPA